jgi:hypothetical protein
MPSQQVTAVAKNLNSVSKQWAFSGELAEIGHAFAMGILKPGKNIKFKEIHVVVPRRKLYNFHEALYKKGYLVNTMNPKRNILRFKHPRQKRPVVLFVKNVMPRVTSYKEGNRLVSLSAMPNTSMGVSTMKTFVRTIQNLQNNVN